ncbi:MAG: hypothetical protein ABL888_14015 [Pirellulaceae bacterium]
MSTVRRHDGGIVDVELIRPRLWLQAFDIAVGKPLPLNIHELQIEGFALVTAIEPCPAISSGEGSVVTGRFVTRQVHRKRTPAALLTVGLGWWISVLEI